MEGVLMRGKSAEAIAVRAADGEIVLETRRIESRGGLKKIPIVRGVIAFGSSLVSGTRALLRSAEVSLDEEEAIGGGAMTIAVLLGVLLSVGLFILLPSALVSLAERLIAPLGALVSGVVEGALRIVIFITYLFLVGLVKDIRRTYMYHGAEHRTINCYEKGMEMTVENVQKCSTRHNRCGTTFLFFVVTISIMIFALTNYLLSLTGIAELNAWYMRLFIRLLLLPIVAGLSYELLRALAALPDNAFTAVLRAPGLALQRLTTCAPDDSMAEVALKSFLAVLAMDEDPSIKEVKFFEKPFAETRKELKAALAAADKPEIDFDFMVSDILGITCGEIGGVESLEPSAYRRLKSLIKRRVEGEPIDYILGNAEFYGKKLKVTEAVLCPRSETELLVENAIGYIKKLDGVPEILDLCTGSGCIALALLNFGKVTASDYSEAALEIARENLKDRAKVVRSDMLDEFTDARFDLIVSNPPYIKTADLENLDEEVKREPRIALDGGENGLKYYERIKTGLVGALKRGGALMLEIGYDIGAEVKALFSSDFESVEVVRDYSNCDRLILCYNYIP